MKNGDGIFTTNNYLIGKEGVALYADVAQKDGKSSSLTAGVKSEIASNGGRAINADSNSLKCVSANLKEYAMKADNEQSFAHNSSNQAFETASTKDGKGKSCQLVMRESTKERETPELDFFNSSILGQCGTS